MISSLHSHLRASIRLITLIVCLTFINILFLSGFLLTYPFKNLSRKWQLIAKRIIGSWMLKLLGARLSIKGKIPKKPFLIITNHLSYVDIFVVFYALKVSMISKKEVSKWFFVGSLAKSLKTVFIDRKNIKDLVRVKSIVKKRLNNNEGLVLFPEGTSSNGSLIYPFKTPLFAIPADLDLPVYYCVIRYQSLPGQEDASTSVCWWGDMTMLPHLYNMLKMPYFKATIEIAEKSYFDKNRKTLAKVLHEKMENLYFKSTSSISD